MKDPFGVQALACPDQYTLKAELRTCARCIFIRLGVRSTWETAVETDVPAPPFQGSLQIRTLNPGLTPWAFPLDPFGVLGFAPETSSPVSVAKKSQNSNFSILSRSIDVPRLQRSTRNSFDISRPYGRAYALPAFQAWDGQQSSAAPLALIYLPLTYSPASRPGLFTVGPSGLTYRNYKTEARAAWLAPPGFPDRN